MAKDRFIVRAKFVFENERAVEALATVEEVLVDMLETFPGHSELKRAHKALRYAARRIVVEITGTEQE